MPLFWNIRDRVILKVLLRVLARQNPNFLSCAVPAQRSTNIILYFLHYSLKKQGSVPFPHRALLYFQFLISHSSFLIKIVPPSYLPTFSLRPNFALFFCPFAQKKILILWKKPCCLSGSRAIFTMFYFHIVDSWRNFSRNSPQEL